METWRSVVGYEGLYEVSDLGRVKSLFKIVMWGVSKTVERIMPEKILALQVDQSTGYYSVMLTKDGVHKRCSVHRMVASAFIPNPDEFPEVNHIDAVRTNCTFSNLEWVTRSKNHLHAYKIGNKEMVRYNMARYAIENKSQSVMQISLDGAIIEVFPSQQDAARKLGVKQESISRCISGKYKSAGGFIWKRA
jgi:hypothetical protein